MKITFEMDNLQDLIEKSVSKNIEEAVKSQVEDTIKEQVAKLGGDIISEVVTKNFNEFVNDYITNTKITVRKEDFWGDADVNEYTVEEYIKKCLKERLDNEKFKTKDKYGHINEISFSEYIKNNYTWISQTERALAFPSSYRDVNFIATTVLTKKPGI